MDRIHNGFSGESRRLLTALVTIIIFQLALTGCAGSNANVFTQTLSEPLNGATAARVEIHRYSGDLTIEKYTGNEPVLVSGNLAYLEGQEFTKSTGADGQTAVLSLATDVRQAGFRPPWEGCDDDTLWQISLNPNVPSDIDVYSGGGEISLDLTGIAVTRVSAETGGGIVNLVLPENGSNLSASAKSGAGNVNIEVRKGFTGTSTISAESGAGTVVVRLPEGLAARIRVSSGAGKAVVAPQYGKIDDTTYQSTNYETASDRVEITVKTGMGSITVETK